MADENKPPEGGDGKPEGDAAKLKTELEKLQAQMKLKDDELAKLESIRKEVEDGRQAAKDRERKALEENGQFKALAEQQAKDVEELRKQISEMSEKLAAAEALKVKADAFDAYEKKQREELLALIPEASRETYKDAPLSVLEATAQIITGDKGGAHRGAGTKPGSGNGVKKWSEMTIAERDKWTAEHLGDHEAMRKKIAEG
jgi:hypothetical protein